MYKQEFRVRMFEADVNRIAKPAALLRELQDTGDRQMFTEKPSYDEIYQSGKAIMLNRFDMNILTEIRLNEVLTCKSWPCPSRRATFLRCYGMWRGEEKVAEISSQWSLVSLSDRKILSIDQVDFTNYTYDAYCEAAPGKLKITPEQEELLERQGEKLVGYSDTDCNGHMNNTYYLNVLCDQIPELLAGTHRVSTIRLHYSKEARAGEVLQVWRTPALPPREGADQEKRYLFRTIGEDGQMNIEAEIGTVPLKK